MSDVKIGRTLPNDAHRPPSFGLGRTPSAGCIGAGLRSFPQISKPFPAFDDPLGRLRVPPAASGLPLNIAGRPRFENGASLERYSGGRTLKASAAPPEIQKITTRIFWVPCGRLGPISDLNMRRRPKWTASIFAGGAGAPSRTP